jgi:hypothetical protein
LVCTLLLDSGLRKFLWSTAADYTVLTCNCLPCSNGKVALQLFFGLDNVDISSFRPHATIASKDRDLSSLWHARKLIKSRDVVFSKADLDESTSDSKADINHNRDSDDVVDSPDSKADFESDNDGMRNAGQRVT